MIPGPGVLFGPPTGVADIECWQPQNLIRGWAVFLIIPAPARMKKNEMIGDNTADETMEIAIPGQRLTTIQGNLTRNAVAPAIETGCKDDSGRSKLMNNMPQPLWLPIGSGFKGSSVPRCRRSSLG
jgi:hypothetical protein